MRRLNLLTRDRVLEDFLQENPPCRQLFSELFYCRYPYFKEQESTENASGDEDQKLSLAGSFDEAFESKDPGKTDSISWLPVVKGIVYPYYSYPYKSAIN